MAFGTNSKAMAYTMVKILTKTIKLGSGGDTCKFLLFGNSTTPANTVSTKTHASYKGTGSTWSTAHEVATGSGYTQGGKTLTLAVAQSTTHAKVTATSLSWTSASFTAYGGAADDTTITGTTPLIVCYNSFGGAQTVTSGTFTVTFSATGLLEYNC